MADVDTIQLPPITQGATYVAVFTVMIGGVPQDLTTYTSVIWDMALGPAPDPIALTASTSPPGNGYVTVNSSGNVTVTIPNGVTSGLAAGQYQWELKLTDSSGNVSKPVGGTIVVNSTIAV